MKTFELTAIKPRATGGKVSAWRDWLGIVASVGCAIHCAAMPFVFAYLPALGLSFLADEAFHKWMALFCFLIAIVAFIPGLRKHGSWVPVSIGGLGLAIITFAAFGLAGDCCPACATEDSVEAAVATHEVCCDECEAAATDFLAVVGDSTSADGVELNPVGEKNLLGVLAPWMTPFGGMLLVSAHLMNHRNGFQCGCCRDTTSATC